jgi:manganese oxidase
MRIAYSIATLVVVLPLGSHARYLSVSSQERATALANDNRTPAGQMRGDTLLLRLSVVPARWFVLGEQNPAFDVVAFAEEGKPPSIPGPLVRVRTGTNIRATLRNALADTIIFRGLTELGTSRDSVVVLPGQTTELRFVANRVGAHAYWAQASGARALLPPQMRTASGLTRPGYDSQLAGAFIVDPAGPVAEDRVFVLTELADQDRCGRPCRSRHGVAGREFTAFNGRAWPHTERLRHAVGDTIRWRFVNAALQPHPLHLHGFYFRVDAHGHFGTGIDTLYTPEQQRMAVTEGLGLGETVSITWSPDRPGGWIFHCHLTHHVAPLPPVNLPDSLNYPEAHTHGDPDQHVLRGMNGLVLGVTVTGGAPAREANASRKLRLFIQSDSTRADTARRFGYVLQRGAEPRRDSVEYPGPVLVLTRGEPTSIEVLNRTAEPTAVHWHGIELDGYYDGAVGWSGTPGRIAPAIRPGSTFEVRITPKRAGTFMYHTHFDELRQQYGGLIGALVVLEPGERWDPSRDFVFLISDNTARQHLINGAINPPDVSLTVGTQYRFRIGDLSVNHPVGNVRLVRGDTVLTWRRVAKDGFTLPESHAAMRRSIMRIASGETVDVLFTPDAPGDLSLEYQIGPSVRRIRLRVSGSR